MRAVPKVAFVAWAALLVHPRGHAQEAQAFPTAATLDLQRRDQEIKLTADQAERERLEATRRALPQRVRAAETNLAAEVRALYRLQRGGLLPLAGGLDAWLGHASRVAHLERNLARTLAALQNLHAEDAEIGRALGALDTRMAERTRTLAAITASAARAAEEAARAAEAQARADARLQYGLSIVGGVETEDGPSFAHQRGSLALPVASAHSVRRSSLPTAGGRALGFETEPGMAVRAVAAGQVTFAGADPTFGKLVVVAHGRRFETRYASLETIDVQAGDTISKSTRIGTASPLPVHFEVRRGTRTTDARAWLGLP